MMRFSHEFRLGLSVGAALCVFLVAAPARGQYGNPGEPLYNAMDKAFKALAQKDYDTAITFLQKAAQIAPQRTEIHKQLGYAYIRTGQTEPAIREFERVRELAPKDYSALLQLGYLCDRTKRDEEATEVFEQVAASPDPEAAKAAQAALGVLGDKYTEEISRLQSALISQPENPEVRKQLGLILVRIRKPQEAMDQLQVVAQASPTDAEVSYALGKACLMTGRRELGLWYLYNASHGSDPKTAARAQQALGKTDLRGLLGSLVSQYPHDNRFRRDLGFFLVKQKLSTDAIAQFEAAVEQDSHDLVSLLELGRLYVETGQKDKARAAFEAVVAAKDSTYSKQAEDALQALGGTDPPKAVQASPPSDPPDPPSAVDPPAVPPDDPPEDINQLRAKGFRLHQEGKVAEAIRVFEQIHALAPKDCSVMMQIGYWYWDLKDSPKAKQWFQSATDCPDSGQAATARKAIGEVVRSEVTQYKVAGFHRKDAGDVHGAIAEFERVLAADPTDYNAMMQIGYWYFDVHEYKQAEKWFRMATASPNPAEALTAKKAVANLAPMLRPYFFNTYMNPFFDSRFGDFILYGQTKLGLKLGHSAWRVEPYLSLRVGVDTRTRGGALPRIFSDDAIIPGVGVQVHPFTPYVNVFAEAGSSVSILAQPPAYRGRAQPDYRGGVAYFRGWGTNLLSDRTMPHGFLIKSGFRDVYFDTEYYSRFGKDVIGYLQYREGFTIPAEGPFRTQVFALANLAKDSKGDYYNNVFEFGPGLRTAWKEHPQLSLYAEFVHGVYLTEGRRTLNNGGPNFNDARVFFVYQTYF